MRLKVFAIERKSVSRTSGNKYEIRENEFESRLCSKCIPGHMFGASLIKAFKQGKNFDSLLTSHNLI